MKDLKVIFMGTPVFCVPILEELIKETNVLAVVTQPDKEVGRKHEISFSPIKKVAIKNNIKVLQPVKIKEEYEDIISLNPDIIITCAYGQIVPLAILNCPKYGCINVHASLLPKLRGGAPIHKAIINGYDKTGITIMYMDKGMDTGDMIEKAEVKIEEKSKMTQMQHMHITYLEKKNTYHLISLLRRYLTKLEGLILGLVHMPF